MIVIDTNVISEMMRDNPDPNVLSWAADAGQLHSTAFTLAEVEYGIARLPAGRRRDQLTATADDVFADFADAILPFDARAARQYASILAGRDAAGLPITIADDQHAKRTNRYPQPDSNISPALRRLLDFTDPQTAQRLAGLAESIQPAEC